MSAYADEEALEKLIEKSPDLLPGAAGTLPAVVIRQIQVAVGIIDLLGVSAAGDVTIVECKLRANPEIRRHIVGQLFAYASALWELDYEGFEHLFASKLGKPLVDAVAGIRGDGFDAGDFRAKVAANLQSGRFRLIIAVDAITPELKRIVEYLNDHTIAEVEVIALELGYLADGDLEILVPTVYGQEAAERKSQAIRHQTTEQELFDWLERECTPDGVVAIRRLFDWSTAHGTGYSWGKGVQPSTSAWFSIEGAWVSTWACFTQNTPNLAINFGTLIAKVTVARLERLLSDLRAVRGLASQLVGLEDHGFHRYPSFPIDALLAKPGVAEGIERALDHLLAD